MPRPDPARPALGLALITDFVSRIEGYARILARILTEILGLYELRVTTYDYRGYDTIDPFDKERASQGIVLVACVYSCLHRRGEEKRVPSTSTGVIDLASLDASAEQNDLPRRRPESKSGESIA